MKKHVQAPLREFRVWFTNWTEPTDITATSVYTAKQKAYKRFPVCDCGCGEDTEILKVEEKLRIGGITK